MKSVTVIMLSYVDFMLRALDLVTGCFKAILASFHCTCTEMAIYELLLKILALPFDSLTLIRRPVFSRPD